MNILNHFKKLSSTQKLELINQLKSSIGDQTKILSLKETPENCPNCNSDSIVRFGSYSGKRRYKCKSCNKTFSDLTGTSISYIKKTDKWFPFIELMLENKSIRYISEELKLSTKTIFEWRHKVLSSLEETFTKEFKGIVETDDIYFNLNQKGRKKDKVDFGKKKRGISDQKVSVMVTMDRYKTMDMKIVKLGRISKDDLERVIPVERLNKDDIICSDKHRSISSFVKSLELEHKKIDSNKKQYVLEGLYHVQNVNNITSSFRKWISSNFNNVSTKYLQNYMYMFEIIQVMKGKGMGDKIDKLIQYSLEDNKTIKRKENIENSYQKMLEF